MGGWVWIWADLGGDDERERKKENEGGKERGIGEGLYSIDYLNALHSALTPSCLLRLHIAHAHVLA